MEPALILYCVLKNITEKGRGTLNPMEAMSMCIILSVAMVSWVDAYVQTHQNVHIKYPIFLYTKYT